MWQLVWYSTSRLNPAEEINQFWKPTGINYCYTFSAVWSMQLHNTNDFNIKENNLFFMNLDSGVIMF